MVILKPDNPVNLSSDVSAGVTEALLDCGASTSQTSHHGGLAGPAQLSLNPLELSSGFTYVVDVIYYRYQIKRGKK